MRINVTLEEWPGSAVIYRGKRGYRRKPAADCNDDPGGLTPRQAVFYRNLIRIAEALGTGEIPVDFCLANDEQMILDRGCMKIAEFAGFIQPLRDGPDGVVDTIVLAWNV